MAIAPLWVGIRTTGAAALGRLSTSFRRLAANIRVAYNRFALAGGIPGWLRRLPGHVRRASASFRALARSIGAATRALIMYALASRAAQALSDGMARGLATMIPLFAKWGSIAIGALAVMLPLIGAIGNLLPIVMMIVPAVTGAGIALIALKLAFNGVGTALQAGLSGDTEEFEKQLKKLSPSAADTVRTLVGLRDTWKPLQQTVQEGLFHGVAGELKGVSDAVKPIADRWLPRVIARFAEARGSLMSGFANFARDGRLEGVMRNITDAIGSLVKTAAPLARVFGDILVVAAPRFAEVADHIRSAAEAFAGWIRGAKESGKLGQWLDKAMETFGKLKDILVNVGRIFGAIFKASGNEGDDMLTQIVNATKKIADWANGGTGQGVINVISNIVKFLGQAAPIFELWATWFQGMIGIAQAMWTGVSAAFRWGVGVVLGFLDMILQGAAKAFGWVPGLGDKLKKAAADFSAFKDSVNRSLDGIEDETVNIFYKGKKIGDHYVGGAQLQSEYSSGIGGRAVGGPMRPNFEYRINEAGQEFIKLGSGGHAYSARESAGMFGGGGTAQLVIAPGGDGAVAQMVKELLRIGALSLRVDGKRVVPG